MISKIVSILVGPITKEISGVAKDWINKEKSEDEMLAEVEKAVTVALAGMSESQANVLVAEASGENWLQRMWRPMTGFMLGFTIFFWAVLVPVGVDWFGLPNIQIADLMIEWVFTSLLAFGSVYAGGRTLEKVTDKIVARIGK